MKVVIIVVYVDDIVVIGDDGGEISGLKSFLKKEFEIKDLGLLKYFLGIEVAMSRSGIVISQRKYILNLLEKKGLSRHSNRTKSWSSLEECGTT